MTATQNSTAYTEKVGDGNTVGTLVGQASTDKVAFFGGTPVVQPAITAVGTTTATTALNETKIDRLYTALISLGLVNTGG